MIFDAISWFRGKWKLLQKRFEILTNRSPRLALARTGHERGFPMLRAGWASVNCQTQGDGGCKEEAPPLGEQICLWISGSCQTQRPGVHIRAGPLQKGLTPFFKKSPASERELAFVPPWGRGEMKKHFCAAGPFSQDSGRGAPEKHGVGRSYKRARWEPAWGRLGSPRFPPEFPRKLRMGNHRFKMGFAQ